MLITGAGVRAWRRGGDDGEVHGAEKHLLQILHQILPLLFFEFQRVFLLDPPPVPVPLHASAADHGSAQLRLLRVAQEIALPELHLRAPTIPAEQVQNPICVFLDALQVCRKSFARLGRVLICWVFLLCAASVSEAFQVSSVFV